MPMRTAVYTGTKNLYPDMVTATKSLLANSNVEEVYLLVEDDEFPYDLPDCVKTVNVKNQKYFHKDGPNMKTPYSYMALMRAALAFQFPDKDKILSLDVDTIVNKDISYLWEIDISNYYFAASHETHRSHNGLIYTNAGVTMFNLDKLRKEGKAYEMIYVLNRAYFRWVDQDVMNYLCQGRIYDLSSDYNDNDWVERPNDMKIKHYAGIKNWNQEALVKRWKNTTWNDVMAMHQERMKKEGKK